jgi:hypothetical protein
LILTRSTVSNNTAATFAGGLENRYQMSVNTSTVSGNTATGLGGGLYAGQGNTGVVPNTNVIDSTVTANKGLSAVAADTSATSHLLNSIVGAPTTGTNCSGAVTSFGYNLVSDGTCSATATGDVASTAPGLGALANNGGPTLTHLLLPGSAAISTGKPGCASTDQRGTARPSGGACDKGAVEI